ncbi:MAG: hypothetical protein KIS66_08765 [Fimbriimonadaceae bacterium]|nr:hypothetical protein [Fimbriimonadaceae bacterium]
MPIHPNQPFTALGQFRELRQVPGWGGDRKYPHLSNYLATQVTMRDGSWQTAVLGAAAGVIFGSMGGAIGVLVGGMNWPPGPVVSIAGTVAVSVWVTLAVTVSQRRDKADQEAARLRLGSRGVLYRLYTSAFSGGFEGYLPAAVLGKLEEGAEAWWDTRSALESPVWKAASGESPWASAKEKALRSVEAAMSRLLILACEPESEGRRTSMEVVLAEMREVADQVTKLAARHYRPDREPGVSGLRDALGELKMLSAAEDELARVGEEFDQPLGRPESP